MASERIAYSQEAVEKLLLEGSSVMVRGGAGCGKTYSLVQTVKGLLAASPYTHVACITYTNAAADEVTRRVESDRVDASTIHSFLWGFISQFQTELTGCFRNLLKDKECKSIKLSDDVDSDSIDQIDGISYEDYPDPVHGIVSHDGVIDLSYAMFRKYKKLRRLVADCYPFIFVDEYQDTAPKVIGILSDCSSLARGATMAFFGDAMQNIYDGTIGAADELVSTGKVNLLEIEQNRRNPLRVISVANNLRRDEDDIEQQPSNDSEAPNMVDGKPREGTARLAFVSDDMGIQEILDSPLCSGWDQTKTKVLCLTHKLIARTADFEKLLSTYNENPIISLARELHKTESGSLSGMTLAEATRHASKQQSIQKHITKIGSDSKLKELYDSVAKRMTVGEILGHYRFKQNKLFDNIDVNGIGKDWDFCTCALRRAYDLVRAYGEDDFSYVIASCSHLIDNPDGKTLLLQHLNCLKELFGLSSTSAGSVLDFLWKSRLLPKDSKGVKGFQESNPYAYELISSIPIGEFCNLFRYLDENSPFSTQHKVKGLEYENVLFILNTAGWSKYDFSYVFDATAESRLSANKRKSFQSKKSRTKKLLYVGCTRAKENLLLCATKHLDTRDFRIGAENLLSKENVIDYPPQQHT